MKHRLLAKPRVANTTLNDLTQVAPEYVWAVINISNGLIKAWSVVIYDARDWEIRTERAFRNHRLNETFSSTERNEILELFKNNGLDVMEDSANKNMFCVKGEAERDKLAFLLHQDGFAYCEYFEQWLSDIGHRPWPKVFLQN